MDEKIEVNKDADFLQKESTKDNIEEVALKEKFMFSSLDVKNINSFMAHTSKLEKILDSNHSATTNLFFGITLNSEKEINALAVKARALLHPSEKTGSFSIWKLINRFAYEHDKQDILNNLKTLKEWQKDTWAKKHSMFSYYRGNGNYQILEDDYIVNLINNAYLFHLEGNQKIPDSELWLGDEVRTGEILISYWKIISIRSSYPIALTELIKEYFDKEMNLKSSS